MMFTTVLSRHSSNPIFPSPRNNAQWARNAHTLGKGDKKCERTGQTVPPRPHLPPSPKLCTHNYHKNCAHDYHTKTVPMIIIKTVTMIIIKTVTMIIIRGAQFSNHAMIEMFRILSDYSLLVPAQHIMRATAC
jgi:hypothetical protein